MTNAQKLQIRLSEIRSRLSEIEELEGDAFTAEIRAENDQASGGVSGPKRSQVEIG